MRSLKDFNLKYFANILQFRDLWALTLSICKYAGSHFSRKIRYLESERRYF